MGDPGPADEATHGDDRVGEVEERVNHLLAAFAAEGWNRLNALCHADGSAARRGASCGLALFPAASRRTGFDGFPIVRLSSDYCVSGAAGCPAWIWSWQEAQTTRVLRRLLAMALAHKGWSGPGLARSASLRTW